MQRFKTINEKIKKIEYKLGVNYVKTDHKSYKRLWVFKLICVIYLFGINGLTLLSAHIHKIHAGQIYFKTPTFILLIVGTVLEIAGVVIDKLGFHITANAFSIVPLPYFTVVFAPLLEDFEGFLGYDIKFYSRYFVSYVFIFIFSVFMLIIAIRQQVKTRNLYKRVIESIYEEYKNKYGDGNFSVSEEDWDRYVKNFDPRKNKIDF